MISLIQHHNLAQRVPLDSRTSESRWPDVVPSGSTGMALSAVHLGLLFFSYMAALPAEENDSLNLLAPGVCLHSFLGLACCLACRSL